MQLGFSTFGEIPIEHISGNARQAKIRMEQLIQEAVLADELGLDVVALGEHHRPDFVISAPEVVLAAFAAKTGQIKLSSAVTVLSSADPVRVFQNFATLDLLSNGRAEIMAGRGSFIESFPLFGYDLHDYEALFLEKLDLLLQINQHEILNWKGKHRAAIQELGVYPRPAQAALPIWVAVGGTSASAVRAGSLNLPMVIAILGGDPAQFLPLVQLHRDAAVRAGHDVSALQLCINQHMYVAEDSENAANEFWPGYSRMMNRIGKERGWSPISRQQYEYLRGPHGPLLVGSPDEIAAKIISESKMFGNTRFMVQTLMADLPHDKVLNSLHLFGSKVAPLVHAAMG